MINTHLFSLLLNPHTHHNVGISCIKRPLWLWEKREQNLGICLVADAEGIAFSARLLCYLGLPFNAPASVRESEARTTPLKGLVIICFNCLEWLRSLRSLRSPPPSH